MNKAQLEARKKKLQKRFQENFVIKTWRDDET